MKSSKILSLAAAAALILTPFTTFAQSAPAAPAAPDAPAAPAPQGHARKGGMGARAMDHRLKLLTEKLNLTADQQTKIKDIWKDAAEKGRAARQDPANEKLSREERRAKAEAMMKDAHDQVRAVLTADQQAIFDKLPADGPGRGGKDKGEKGPKQDQQ